MCLTEPRYRLCLLVVAIMCTILSHGHATDAQSSSDWPSWRGDGSGSSDSGEEMVDSLSDAKLAWQSDPIGLSGCMYPGGRPGTGWCDPIIANGRVFVYHFRRAGTDLVDYHNVIPGGWGSLIGEISVGRSMLPKEEMAALLRHVRADDIIDCFDDRTGKTLWRRVFPGRGVNHVRVYSPLCVPCVHDGVLYALGSSGRVYALDVETGNSIWESDIGRCHSELDLAAEIAAKTRYRAYRFEAPLNVCVVYADGVVAVPEGEMSQEGSRSGVVGLDAATGRRLWVVPDCCNRFNSIGVYRHAGKEYFLVANKRLALIEPKTGKVLWSVNPEENGKTVSGGVVPAVKGDFVALAKNVVKMAPGQKHKPWMMGGACYRISPSGAELLWKVPVKDTAGISMIAPVIHGEHAYIPTKQGVVPFELTTGKPAGKGLPFAGAYDGYAIGNGMLFRCIGGGRIRAAKAFPAMELLGGTLPGKPDTGEIHTPATANGRVYWRGQRSIWCYDFRKNPPAPSNKVLPGQDELSGIAEDPVKLAEAFAGKNFPTRAAAAERLRLLGAKAKPALPALQQALLAAVTAKSWGDVDLLIDSLQAIDPAATVPAAEELAKLLSEQDERLVRLGCHGLRLMGPQAAAATAALARLLDPSKPWLAAVAARALGAIGPGASQAAVALKDLLSTEDEGLLFEASRALCRLAPTDPDIQMAAINGACVSSVYVRFLKLHTTARFTGTRSVTLAQLGKAALPQLLIKAQEVVAMKRRDENNQLNDFNVFAELAAAAYSTDPASATEFLPLFDKLPGGNAHQVRCNRHTTANTKRDLAGTLDIPAEIRRKTAKKKADLAKKHAEQKKRAEERKKAQEKKQAEQKKKAAE